MHPCWPNLTQIRPTLPLFPGICPPCLRSLGGSFPKSLWGHFLNWYTFGWLSFVLLFEALIYRSVKFYKIGPWWDVFSCYSESHFYLWCPAFSNVSNLALVCLKLGRDQAREVPWPQISRGPLTDIRNENLSLISLATLRLVTLVSANCSWGWWVLGMCEWSKSRNLL